MGSNLGRGTGYPDREFSWVSPVHPGKFQNNTSTRSLELPSKSFPIHQSSYDSTLYSLRYWQRRKINRKPLWVSEKMGIFCRNWVGYTSSYFIRVQDKGVKYCKTEVTSVRNTDERKAGNTRICRNCSRFLWAYQTGRKHMQESII
jgi:hypothetical protein